MGPRTDEQNDRWIGGIGQIEEVKETVGKRRIDALVISIGVNDVGFTGSLKNLVMYDFGWGNDTANRKKEVERIRKKIDQLRVGYDELDRAIRQPDEKGRVLDVGQVYITEYPTALFDKIENGRIVPSAGCEIFSSYFDMDITPRDAEDLKSLAGELNEAIETAAETHSWVYVGGIADRFAGHGYCTGKKRFFVTAEESLAVQGDTEGTLHPNRKGHAIIASALTTALRAGLGSKVTRPGTPSHGAARRRLRKEMAPTTSHGTVVRDHRR